MKAKLKSVYTFNTDISDYFKEIKGLLIDIKEKQEEKKEGKPIIFNIEQKGKKLHLEIIYVDRSYPHQLLFEIRNRIKTEFGKKYHLTIKELEVPLYEIEFELDKEPLAPFELPFVDEIKYDDTRCLLLFRDVKEERVLQKQYVNRIVKRIKEKIELQHYIGKAEFSEILWASEKKDMIWNKDPSKEMFENGWIAQAKTKGKWFFGPQFVKILRAMEKLVLTEIAEPLKFNEVIEPHHESFSTLLRTGHLEGVPMEYYYVCEPKTRTPEDWEDFIDYLKITKEIPIEILKEKISPPNAINCYVQCPNIYEFFSGKTIGDDQFPLLVFDKAAVSNRYESGGRHGIERMDEFHRIELVYIGTKGQLIEVKDKLIEKYKLIFNEILDLEWRMSWVTPFYLQHSGQLGLDDNIERIKGTIDFEAYLPYRGSREDSEWLEFQNLSILGDKYIRAFNIKAQRLELWSGCSGIGLERWCAAFLSQKGLNPNDWPNKFRKIVGDLPKQIVFY
ncbi:MAG: serine--tRNA ligase [Candidatus Helarchaeota archaeon]|nr:serine--tRNA ligase [Candidatus Helarchaeota archaeon]